MSALQKSLFFVVAVTIGFGVAGGLVGALIGNFAPGYYQAVFDGGANPEFCPLEVGIGLGVTQGLAVGVAVAITLVLASAIVRGRGGGGANQHHGR